MRKAMDLESSKQSVFYVVNVVLSYKDFQEAKQDAPNDIAAHIAPSKELHEKGRLLMSGAFLNNPGQPLTTMAVLASREAAEEYIKGDPFFKKGMIKKWYIREWANMFAHSSAGKSD
jgi:uncharacterized protein YciI